MSILIVLHMIRGLSFHLQHLDSEVIRTERPGEIIAYYKIASKFTWCMRMESS